MSKVRSFVEISYPVLRRILHDKSEEITVEGDERAEVVEALRASFPLTREQNSIIDGGGRVVGSRTPKGKGIGFFGGRYWRTEYVRSNYVPE